MGKPMRFWYLWLLSYSPLIAHAGISRDTAGCLKFGSNLGIDKQFCFCGKVLIFSYPSDFLGDQKNHLIETVLLSTHNICFG